MTNKKEQEIWRTCPDYDFIEISNLGNVRTKDRYVTDKNGKKRFVKGRILKQQLLPNGYMQVGFSVNGKQVHLYVHRMVATCYIPNPNNYPQVNHIDCNRSNNIIDNLEWCTNQYNTAYREKYGKSAAEVFGRSVFAVDLETGKAMRFETRAEAACQLSIDDGHIFQVVKGERQQAGGYWFTEDENEITEGKIQEIKAKMWTRQVIAINSETFEVLRFKSQHEASRKLRIAVQNINKVVKGKQNKAHGWWFCNADENAVEKVRKKFGDEIANKVEKLIIEDEQEA